MSFPLVLLIVFVQRRHIHMYHELWLLACQKITARVTLREVNMSASYWKVAEG